MCHLVITEVKKQGLQCTPCYCMSAKKQSTEIKGDLCCKHTVLNYKTICMYAHCVQTDIDAKNIEDENDEDIMGYY